MVQVPTVELVGPAGRRIVNESDLDMWKAKGYKLVGEEPEPSGPEPVEVEEEEDEEE